MVTRPGLYQMLKWNPLRHLKIVDIQTNRHRIKHCLWIRRCERHCGFGYSYYGWSYSCSSSIMWLSFNISYFPYWHHLVIVTQMTVNLVNGPISGLIGLGFQKLASTGAVPFWEAVAGQLDSPEMSFWFERNLNPVNETSLGPGGVFTLGGTNSSLFIGDIEFHNLVSTPSFWLLTLSSTYNSVSSLSFSTFVRYHPQWCSSDTLVCYFGRYRHRDHSHWRTPRWCCEIVQSYFRSCYDPQPTWVLCVPYVTVSRSTFLTLANLLSLSLQYKCIHIDVLWREFMANQPRGYEHSNF